MLRTSNGTAEITPVALQVEAEKSSLAVSHTSRQCVVLHDSVAAENNARWFWS